jgi:hypothetical protein
MSGRIAPALVVLVLAAVGLMLDGSRSVPQPVLFLAVFSASLLGALGAMLGSWSRVSETRRRLVLLGVTWLAWRLAYFPIMVFSGHVASIGEWLLVRAGPLPVLVWPTFLLSVAALHAAAGGVASWLVRPSPPALRAAGALAFGVAALVSFTTLSDLRWLPDTAWSVERAVPAPRLPTRNPYLPRLAEAGYSVPQRVLLVAAGLTYDTIPESPWAGTVKGVLEAEFDANPRASSASRVEEHYLAYRSAHAFIGCRRPGDCPAGPDRDLEASLSKDDS